MPICPCCDKDYTQRTIDRHLAIRAERLAAALDAMEEDNADEIPDELFEESDPSEADIDSADDAADDAADVDMFNVDDPAPHDDDPAHDDPAHDDPAHDDPVPNDPVPDDAAPNEGDLAPEDDPAPHGDIPAVDQAAPAPGNAGPHRRVVDLAALIAMEDEILFPDLEPIDDNEDMDLDNGDDLFDAPPPIPPDEPGLPRNPVVIDDWSSDHEWPDEPPLPDSDDDDAHSDDSADQNFDFQEGVERLEYNPDAEPDMEDDEFWAHLWQNFGELAEEEWLDIYNRFLTDEDELSLKFLATRLRTHMSRAAYEDLRQHPCAELELPSDNVAWRRLKVLSRLESVKYAICVNSCCAFLGKYADLDSCPFCDQPRRNAQDKPRRTFQYTPLIPQLIGLFQNRDMVKKLRHRFKHDQHRAEEPGKISDVFDGEIYRTLRNTRVHEEDDYRYFDNPDDIALGLATDGFNMFKRRRKGWSTAWPIILVNYNLHPSIRTRLENIICVAVVPGPRECKDINSFLVPLIEELLELADGVEASKVQNDVDEFEGDGIKFTLRAFLIILFGDILAIKKLLLIKGHNGVVPCRTCLIMSTPCQLRANQVRYVPLTAPGDLEPTPPGDLPMRTHQSFLDSYDDLDAAPNAAQREEIAQDCGINARTIFARLGSIDLSSCAPYEMMHLIFENLVPNMLYLWKGEFKWLNHAGEAYTIAQDVWKSIGERTLEANRTIPSQFVGTLPDINKDQGLYKADAFSFWFIFLAPVLLHGKLAREHYEHYLDMREILILCLELEITDAQVADIERRVNEWVVTYERLYYKYEYDRLPTCMLTIHALLHMAYYIRRTGPLSATWSFVMERFCGYLLRPALANRVRPYDYLDNFIRRRGQMRIVSIVHNKPELVRPPTPLTLVHGELISSKEHIYESHPRYIFGQPVNRRFPLTEPFKRQMTKYFGLAERRGDRALTSAEIRERIDWDTLVRYGQFRIASMGDRVRVADLVDTSRLARDNSFIRYELLPDRNVNRWLAEDRPRREVHYGRVLDTFYVEYIRDLETNVRVPYVLARIQECVTGGLDAARPENPIVVYNQLKTPDIIHLGTVDGAVGRIKVGGRNTWAIIDRTRGARTQFNNDAGEEDPDVED